MIALFTDFGLANPYVGQMHLAVAALNENVKIVDLFHHAPAFDAKRSAYMLKALSKQLPPRTVVIGVVDPGVGSDRHAIAVSAHDRWYIGPDNGLFSLILADDLDAAIYELDKAPNQVSASFHGRDIFAPAAAMIAQGKLDSALSSQELSRSITRDFALLWPKNLAEVIYIDNFGNATTGIRAKKNTRQYRALINYATLAYHRTFSSAKPGQPFWTVNSLGLVEIAANQANAAEMLSLSIGDEIELV